jgi:hypothetical protein
MENEGKGTADHDREAVQAPLRKPYATPRLMVHGTVEEITRSIGTKGTDGVIGSRPGG